MDKRGVASELGVVDAVSVSNAFTFNFTSPPTQCANATVQWSEGTPPYHLLLVPTGALHPVEVRVISDHTINSGTTFSFPLLYPGNSTFVAVMSDATGFGSGGTSLVTTVAESKNKACIRKTLVAPEFFIFTNPPVPQQCAPMQISYNDDAHAPVDVFVVIPGGASSRVKSGAPQNRTFSWTPALENGTQLLIVAGDTLGPGKGGSTDILTVAPGNNTQCLPVQAPPTNATAPPTNATTPPTASTTPSSDATPRLSISMTVLIFGLLFVASN